MIMDSLEPIAFGEPSVHFHHLLNFDTFKTDVVGDEASAFAGRAGPVPPGLVVRASEAAASGGDSLNTPISTFMELPIFFGTSMLPPPTSVLAGKRRVPCPCVFAPAARSRKTRRPPHVTRSRAA